MTKWGDDVEGGKIPLSSASDKKEAAEKFDKVLTEEVRVRPLCILRAEVEKAVSPPIPIPRLSSEVTNPPAKRSRSTAAETIPVARMFAGASIKRPRVTALCRTSANEAEEEEEEAPVCSASLSFDAAKRPPRVAADADARLPPPLLHAPRTRYDYASLNGGWACETSLHCL